MSQTSLARGKGRRAVGGVELCRACYQLCWKIAKREEITIEAAFAGLPPKLPYRPYVETACARPGCTRRLAKDEARRFIGTNHLHLSCFQSVWEYSKREELSMVQALMCIPRKGWRPPRPDRPEPPPFSCVMPWCGAMTEARLAHPLTDGSCVCPMCSRYLKDVALRFRSSEVTWEEWGVRAKRGEVIAPHTEEPCSASWCDRMVVGDRHGGVNKRYFDEEGHPFCQADYKYFLAFAFHKDISFAEAFATAPVPRLFHIRRA